MRGRGGRERGGGRDAEGGGTGMVTFGSGTEVGGIVDGVDFGGK